MGYLKCDAPNEDNINTYQEVAKDNKESKVVIEKYIIMYLNGIAMSGAIIKKSFLFSFPDEGKVTSAYLVAGDKVKIIKISTDDKWLNIGYINANGIPLIAWITADSIEK